MKLPSKKSIIQFVKFGAVGASNTFVSLAVYYVFILIDGHLYLAGNIVGWIVSVANSYLWNSRYVFNESEVPWFRKLMRTYLSYGITFFISTVLLSLEVNVLSFSIVYAPIINLVATIPFNFFLNKFWTYSNKTKQ